MEISRKKLISMLDQSHSLGRNSGFRDDYHNSIEDVMNRIDKYETDIETKANDRALKIKCLECNGRDFTDTADYTIIKNCWEWYFSEILESMDLYARIKVEEHQKSIEKEFNLIRR